ncbi:sensor histidine kinase [Clostridium fallax]|uniref:histidine kinase n=1 Tax=Clostridium fallax TaxID=1533 RepID=A0A1M4WW73_9CLOT|nr:HAMP domain-containing sensor histidine kinase [Clostridium fallax]SHE85407.1 Signal transduction histidine kinase [Clostridium fallax]SQB07437.1 two-component sensor histidine kinase [Clostridium fallax]
MKIFNHKPKRKKLANLLLKNYIISFILMSFVILSSTIIATFVALIYFDLLPSNMHDPNILMNENYKSIDSSKLEELGGFILIVDKDFNIIYSKGEVKGFNDKITLDDFNRMINDSDYSEVPLDSKEDSNDYIYKSSYNKEKGFMLIVAIPADKYREFTTRKTKINGKEFASISILICVLLLSLIFIIYSRITSRYFIKPLKKLIDGANKLAHGKYDARIELETTNEFADLSDAFNVMAMKIEKERKLKEKSEEQRKRLILDISHDLKNPLASIMGYSSYLNKTNDISKEDLKKYLSVIESNSIRANDLIQELFQFSKLESPDFSLSLKNQDICEFLRTLIANYITELEDKGFIYDFEIPETPILVDFDSKNLDRAFSNIITNCLKYNPPGTKFIITLNSYEDHINIIFYDTGIGIDKSKIETIFNPFVRVDESRNSKSGGTGLGLAITKSIVLKHKGSINLISNLGEGSKFIINIPISQK